MNEIKKKSRILIVSQHFPPEKSGNASRIYDLSKHLTKQGAKVIVISPPPTFPHGSFKKTFKLISKKIIDNIEHYQIFTFQPTKNDPSFFKRMLYYLSFPINSILFLIIYIKNYDIIITSAPPVFTGIAGLFIKKFFRKKWIFDVRDLWVDLSVGLGIIKKGSLSEKICKKYERICYNNCDLILATTDYIKNTIKNNYKIKKTRIEIIPNGVDINLFLPVSNNEKKNRIIYSGNVGHAQEFENMIGAIKKLNEKYSIKFYIVGDGDIKKNIEKLVKKENLEDIVIFTGPLAREEIPKLIAESYIGVVPLKNLDSLRYAIPTKIYEYMSCGIPFLGTGKGEIEKLAKISRAGIVAESNVESIYQKIVYLLENKYIIEEMGKHGREFVEKYYDRKKIAENLLRIIEIEVT